MHCLKALLWKVRNSGTEVALRDSNGPLLENGIQGVDDVWEDVAQGSEQNSPAVNINLDNCNNTHIGDNVTNLFFPIIKMITPKRSYLCGRARKYAVKKSLQSTSNGKENRTKRSFLHFKSPTKDILNHDISEINLDNRTSVRRGVAVLSSCQCDVKSLRLIWNKVPRVKLISAVCNALQTLQYCLDDIHIYIRTDFATAKEPQELAKSHCEVIMKIFMVKSQHSSDLTIHLYRHFSDKGSILFDHVLEHYVRTEDMFSCPRREYQITDDQYIFTCKVTPVRVDREIPLGNWTWKHDMNCTTNDHQLNRWR